MDIPSRALLPQCFYEHVSTRPEEVYLTQPTGGGAVIDYTFADVMDQAARMAAHLRSLNFPPQSKIAIMSKNCAHFIISDLAIWMAGHVSVALYPTLTADLISYILEHCEAKLLFVGKLDSLEELNNALPEGLLCIAYPLAPETDYPKWDELVALHDPIEDRPESKGDEEALIIYTSGSTGRPKGVLHSFHSLAEPTVHVVKTLGITRDDRVLSYLPLAHGMDRWTSEVISLYIGLHLFFAESLNTFVNDLTRARPTVFVSVPRLWLKFQMGVFRKLPPQKLDLLLRIPIVSSLIKKKVLKGLGLDATRFAISGSAPIPAELLIWYNRLGLELCEGYGMSENFNYSHVTRPGRGRPGYVGEPQTGVFAKLSDEGEVLVKGPGIMVGYYKEPELTKQAFTEDGFLKTGDRGEIDEIGRLKITGRVKDLFKTSKGKYVAPVPIENELNADPHVELSCVLGSGQPATCGLIQLGEEFVDRAKESAGRQELESQLAALLKKTNAGLPDYERMQCLVVTREPWTVEGGQLTPTMKVKRMVIEDRYAPLVDDWFATKKEVIWE